MEKLVLDGVTYVKASVAARNAGYTSDYVGQLCRGGKIDAKLVGRTWYINPDELQIHQVEKRRVARVKAREQVRKSLAEHQQKDQSKQKVVARYESDESDLIPTVRKIVPEVQMSREEQRITQRQIEVGDDFTIENKGNSVLMSGELSVVDADEEAKDTESIILSPKIIRTKKPTQHTSGNDDPDPSAAEELSASAENDQGILGEGSEREIDAVSGNFNFLDRLAQTGVVTGDTVPETAEGVPTPANYLDPIGNTSSTGLAQSVSIVIVGLLVALVQVLVSSVYTIEFDSGMYSTDRNYQIEFYSIKNVLK